MELFSSLVRHGIPTIAFSKARITADLGGGKLPIMRVVGQIGAAFIITEGPDGVFLIDQHAAHERILYEQFMTDWRDEDGVTSQGLVTGTAVHLSNVRA